MNKIIVRRMQKTDVAAWDAFVDQCPGATFFHRAGWKEVIEASFGHQAHYFLAENNRGILGVLPLVEMQHPIFGHALSSLPFCVYGGIAARSDSAQSLLDAEAQRLATFLEVDHLEYKNLNQVHADWPSKDIYVTFRKPIDPDVDQNMKNIPRKQRAMVRVGIKNGLSSAVSDDVDEFYRVFSDNQRRHGTPVLPKSYFKTLQRVFRKDCEMLNVLHEGRVISSVLTFYFRDEVLPYYAGDLVEARALAANDFKYWELMRRACERGYRLFDFGRSKVGSGPFHFKKNWGFEPQPLHYEYKLFSGKGVPDKNPLSPKYRLFVAAWKRLPLPVANLIGPHLVKHLG